MFMSFNGPISDYSSLSSADSTFPNLSRKPWVYHPVSRESQSMDRFELRFGQQASPRLSNENDMHASSTHSPRVFIQEMTVPDTLRQDVLEGLSKDRNQKTLPTYALYMGTGSEMFSDFIKKIDNYYLIQAERTVLKNHANEMMQYAMAGNRDSKGARQIPNTLIELGAGDALKTRAYLLPALTKVQGQNSIYYIPLDVGRDTMEKMALKVTHEFPTVQVKGLSGLFDDVLAYLAQTKQERRGTKQLMAFLGSTMGNSSPEMQRQLIQKIAQAMNPGDVFLVGYDYQAGVRGKKEKTIVDAYNDPYTAAWDVNLLKTLNDELGTGFQRELWRQEVVYQNHGVETSLVCDTGQTVHLGDETFTIEPGEKIFLEESRKYDPDTFSEMFQPYFEELKNFEHPESSVGYGVMLLQRTRENP